MDSEISRRVFKDPAGYQQLDVWISRHIKGTLLFQPPQDLNLFGAKPAKVGFTQLLDGLDCVMVEPDIDYYKDELAHALLEVAVNGITHTLTDPRQVYVLRWIAGRHAGVPNFEPPYTLI